MDRKVISPGVHGLIDYGFGIVATTAPALLGLSGPARLLPGGWAVAQGTLNAVTDQPHAITRLVPFATHGRVETFGLPALFLATVASGALKQPGARPFFAALFAALMANYFLTDYDATPKR